MKHSFYVKTKHLSAIFFKWLKTDVWDFIISPIHPVKRHRILYGWRWGWLFYSVFIAVIVVGIIYVTSNCKGIKPIDLLGQDSPDEDNLLWAIISQFADPGNLHMSEDKGSIIALFCATLGIICLSGLLVSSLVSFISRRHDDWLKGFIYYNRPLGKYFCFNNYVVIIGVNEQTAAIVKASLHRDVKYVLIQSSQAIEKVRTKVNLALDEEEEKKVVFYHGERTSEEDLSKLRLEDANEVYILGEDMHNINEQDHDAYNIACLEHIAKYIQKHPRKKTEWYGRKTTIKERLKCYVNLEYQSTFMAFKFTHMYRDMNDKVEFIPFNVHEIWAKKVLVDNCANVRSDKEPEKYYPLDAYWTKNHDTDINDLKYINQDSDQTVHLIVMGMNQMGVALAMQAALLIHLPNYHTNKNRRTTITFIDENAVREGEYLRSRYDALFSLCRYRNIISKKNTFNHEKKDYITSWIDPMIKGRYAYMGDNFMDLQWEFIEGNVASPEIRSYMSAIVDKEKNKTCTFAVCFNNPQQSIATALYLPEIVLKRALQILVYQQNTFDMINKVANTEKDWKRYRKLKPFGMIEGCYSNDSFDNKLAKFINLLYTDGVPTDSQLKEIGTLLERANQLWNELGIVYKYANINLADSFDMKLRALGESEKEQLMAIKQVQKVHALAKAEHLRWVTERLTMGYRPLDEKELHLLKAKGDNYEKYSKEYFKRKSRAHLDICSCEDLENERDEAVKEKNMDEKIIKMLFTLKSLATKCAESTGE